MTQLREVAFSLGSNLGDAPSRLREARKKLLEIPAVHEITHSSIYETSPVDVDPTFANFHFLNAILILQGTLDIHAWARHAHQIEDSLGRIRDGRRNIPRIIDIDLIYCGNETITSETLTVPHLRWKERRFVLEPLAEVRPNAHLPGTTSSVLDILHHLQSSETVRKTAHPW